MRRKGWFTSFCLSLSLHLLAFLGLQLVTITSPERPGEDPISVELLLGAAGDDTPAGPAMIAAAPPPVTARAIEPPRVAPAPPPKLPPTIDGVRLATAEDIRRRLEPEIEEPAPAPAEEPVVAAAPPPAAEPPAQADAGPVADGTAVEGGGAGTPGSALVAGDGSGSGYRRMILPGNYRPDTPGYYGRIFGQISVRGAAAHDTYYGRVHLFRDDAVYRDYSGRSLFGQSFRQDLGEGAVREFQTGRVQTQGAYLIVTDLFANGRLSTMSHTVVLAFPRQPPAGGTLYDVVEEPAGGFRLRGPNGSSLLFDGGSGALRQAVGFAVNPPGETGSPPRIWYRGLHVRIQSVGGNPFLRGRAATVVDARGGACGLTTGDLFAYEGRLESDMFRFASDREFFAFLADRCPWLELPRPAETPAARTMVAAKPKAAGRADGGLIPALFGGH
jgi:hypothetical protein